ncbi:hypothetical protein ACE6H2_005911 [Prunus campanulata]
MEHPRRDPPIFLGKCRLSWKGLVNFSNGTLYVEGFLPSPVGLWVKQLRLFENKKSTNLSQRTFLYPEEEEEEDVVAVWILQMRKPSSPN